MSNCLLLVDIQNDYFPHGKMALEGIEKAAHNAYTLLQSFRKRHHPVIHVQHIAMRPDATFFLPETSGVEINEMVSPSTSETIICKNFPNSFRNTILLQTLREIEAKTLTICGAMSHMCIDATTRAAFDLDFTCFVAEDACATKNLAFKDTVIKASDVHASFMAALSSPYATVTSTQKILEHMA